VSVACATLLAIGSMEKPIHTKGELIMSNPDSPELPWLKQPPVEVKTSHGARPTRWSPALILGMIVILIPILALFIPLAVFLTRLALG